MALETVPAFLSIDVEPDPFQLSRNETPLWHGFDAMVPFLENLRALLAARNGFSPAFGWYFRTDPQIGQAYGRPDHALLAYADRIAGFLSAGDYIGVHVHPIRWSDDRQCWVHELEDAEWIRSSARSSFEVYAEWAGKPSPYLRYGAGFLNNDVLDVAEACGVRIDLTLEPVAGWGLRATAVPTTVDESPILGKFINCANAPRVPYHPSVGDFRVPAANAAERRMLSMVPLSTVITSRPSTAAPAIHMLYPSVPWASPDHFWDLAKQQLETMERPFLSLAIRTDAHDMHLTARVRSIFEALPQHPIATHLRWMDPLAVVDDLRG